MVNAFHIIFPYYFNQIYFSFTIDGYSTALEIQENILSARDTTTAAEDASSLNSSSDRLDSAMDFNLVAEKLVSTQTQGASTSQMTFSPISDDGNTYSNNTSQHFQEMPQDVVLNPTNIQLLPNIQTFYLDQETAEKLNPVAVGPNEVKLDTIVKKLETLAQIVSEVVVDQKKLIQAVTDLKSRMESMNLMKENNKVNFSDLDNFPIDNEMSLKNFNSKLKDQSYKENIVSYLLNFNFFL